MELLWLGLLLTSPFAGSYHWAFYSVALYAGSSIHGPTVGSVKEGPSMECLLVGPSLESLSPGSSLWKLGLF